MNFNKWIGAGNIAKELELRYLPNGTAVLDLNVATNRTWLNERKEKQEEVTFVGCTAFGRTAEVIAQYCGKGDNIFIEGRLKQEMWEKDGKKNYKTKVIVESFQFGQKSKANQQSQQAPPTSARAKQATAHAPATQPDLPADGDDDVPF